MNNSIKSGMIGLLVGMTPLSSSTNNFDDKGLKNNTNTELFEDLNQDYIRNIKSIKSIEQRDLIGIDPKYVIDAVMNYFDEEVEMYKLSPEARQRINPILNQYLLAHPVLLLGNNGKIEFIIDDKREFIKIMKQIVNIIIDDMPFLVRKIGIPLIFGGNDKLQEKLDNLDATMMNMKEKQYNDIIFDYVGGIVKRIAKFTNGKILIIDYYRDINKYFPNKNNVKVLEGLNKSGQANLDIRLLKYPFKK